MKASYEDLKLELWLSRRERNEILWETKSGANISIKEMSDTHLINAINYLKKQDERENQLLEALGSIGDIDFI
jgi:hypothetical protein